MPKYRITGHDRNFGINQTIVVRANDEKAAAAIAHQKGIVGYQVERVEPPPPPAAETPATPSSPPAEMELRQRPLHAGDYLFQLIIGLCGAGGLISIIGSYIGVRMSPPAQSPAEMKVFFETCTHLIAGSVLFMGAMICSQIIRHRR